MEIDIRQTAITRRKAFDAATTTDEKVDLIFAQLEDMSELFVELGRLVQNQVAKIPSPPVPITNGHLN
jgi:hypothetical protein